MVKEIVLFIIGFAAGFVTIEFYEWLRRRVRRAARERAWAAVRQNGEWR